MCCRNWLRAWLTAWELSLTMCLPKQETGLWRPSKTSAETSSDSIQLERPKRKPINQIKQINRKIEKDAVDGLCCFAWKPIVIVGLLCVSRTGIRGVEDCPILNQDSKIMMFEFVTISYSNPSSWELALFYCLETRAQIGRTSFSVWESPSEPPPGLCLLRCSCRSLSQRATT